MEFISGSHFDKNEDAGNPLSNVVQPDKTTNYLN